MNDPKDILDYRPISIPPILSKVYESLIPNQILDHIEMQWLFLEQQSGYGKGHSFTVTMLLKLKEDFLNAMNKGEITLSVMTNFDNMRITWYC